MTLDLSRVPHLEARKRVGDLLDQRQVIAEEHEKLLEPKVAAIDAELDKLMHQCDEIYRTDYSGDVQTCDATGLVLFRGDEIMRDDDTGAVCLRAILPADVIEKLSTRQFRDDDDGEDDEAEAA